MMRYTTRNEMVEIRSALHLKDKMTGRHKAYKKHSQRQCMNLVSVFIYILDKFF